MRNERVEHSEIDPLERDDLCEPAQKTLAIELADDELPGGTATGTMLHEILENVPLDSLASKPILEDWLESDRVKKVFRMAMVRNGYYPDSRPVSCAGR